MDLEGRRASILLADLEEQRSKALSFVPKQDVDAFAGLYSEAKRMDRIAETLQAAGHDVPNYDFQRDWLDEQLNIGVARDGWRSGQVVDVERSGRDEDEATERYLEPNHGRRWS